MYLRRTRRKNKDGSTVEYLQLAHNERDPVSGAAKAKVLYNFGRADQLDPDALRRLAGSLTRFLDPEDALQAQAGGLRFIASRPLGGAWLLDQLWSKLGILGVIQRLLKERCFASPIERCIFAMVANRALAPLSKLATRDWVANDAAVPGLPAVAVQQLYRAMDFLLDANDAIQHDVFFSVAHLFNLEVDLIYFDTTSTYFEIEENDPDEAPPREPGSDRPKTLRRRGHSKDHRDDLPQIVIGLAVTKEGLPVRCWVWPGQATDVTLVERVKKDLTGWKLGRVVSVWDRGFVSEENLVTLQQAGGHYIVGERMRSGAEATQIALSRGGRYRAVADHLEAKEIVVGDGERRRRYVLVRNPQQAKRDKHQRERILEELAKRLASLGELSGEEHTKAVCVLVAHRLYGRYLRTTKTGKLRIDQAKVRAEERLDGKYLLRTSDDTLSVADIVLGYRQLMDIERAFRSLKQQLEIRPVYHRIDDRLRAHVLLCWLALLMVRVVETTTKQTWNEVRRTLERMHLGEFAGPSGRLLRRTESRPEQTAIFAALDVAEPPAFFDIDTTAASTP